MSDRPKVLIARAVFADAAQRLREHFDVESNEADELWPEAELIRRLQSKAGLFITGTQPIGAELIKACPQLRAICSMAVG